MITALCGGVGGSKLAHGLYRVLPEDSLTVIVNTADDLEYCGLRISPDLDTVTYTLAGLSRPDVGWGVEGDTFRALNMLGRYGLPTWFQVGDSDLATHLFRTEQMNRGRSLGEVTAHIGHSLGVRARVQPMCEEDVRTHVLVGNSWVPFQEYFVHRRHADPVDAVRYDGIEQARVPASVLHVLPSSEAVILVNSNPVLSIVPILSVPGARESLRSLSAPRVAVSPMIGLDSVSGPAGHLMRLTGFEPSSTGVARLYADILNGIIIDNVDAHQAGAIEDMGIRVRCTDIVMKDDVDRSRLAREVLEFVATLR